MSNARSSAAACRARRVRCAMACRSALTYFEPELRPVLKKGGFLTRDSRAVERKKYGTRQGPPLLPVLEALRDADALQAAGEQTFIGLLAGDHRQDLEFGEVAPICHPALGEASRRRLP